MVRRREPGNHRAGHTDRWESAILGQQLFTRGYRVITNLFFGVTRLDASDKGILSGVVTGFRCSRLCDLLTAHLYRIAAGLNVVLTLLHSVGARSLGLSE